MNAASKITPWIILISFAVVAGALVHHQSRIKPEFSIAPPEQDARQPAALPSAALDKQFKHAEITKFTDIAERPLFVPERRPIEASATEAAEQVVTPEEPPVSIQATAPTPELRLVGTAISKQTVIALLSEPGRGELIRLAIGDSHLGWKVTNIDHDHVTLSSGATELDLRLDFKARDK